MEEYRGDMRAVRRRLPAADDLTIAPIYMCPSNAASVPAASNAINANNASNVKGITDMLGASAIDAAVDGAVEFARGPSRRLALYVSIDL